MHGGFGGLNRIMLVVDRRGRTGKVVDFVDFHIERETNIMAHEFKAGMIVQMIDIALGAREQIIRTQDFMALFQQTVYQMRTKKSGPTSDQYLFAIIK